MFLYLSLPLAFSLLIVFVSSLVVAPTRKIALESLWRMVVEVNCSYSYLEIRAFLNNEIMEIHT
jgi:hypothetical protein